MEDDDDTNSEVAEAPPPRQKVKKPKNSKRTKVSDKLERLCCIRISYFVSYSVIVSAAAVAL
jgi:hypothetical protein